MVINVIFLSRKYKGKTGVFLKRRNTFFYVYRENPGRIFIFHFISSEQRKYRDIFVQLIGRRNRKRLCRVKDEGLFGDGIDDFDDGVWKDLLRRSRSRQAVSALKPRGFWGYKMIFLNYNLNKKRVNQAENSTLLTIY